MENEFSRMNVLIVENEMPTYSPLLQYLKNRDCVVETADSGKDAWEYIIKYRFDLIVASEEVNGIAWFFEMIHSAKVSTPIILMTTQEREKNTNILWPNATALVEKPLSIEAFAAALEDCSSARKRAR